MRPLMFRISRSMTIIAPLVAIVSATAGCQTPATGRATMNPMSAAIDSARVALMHRIGARVDGERATLWYPRDSISEPRARQVTRTLDSTIRSIERFAGGPYDGQGPHERITYYLMPESFIAYTAPGPSVFVTVGRLRSDSIAFAHETVHAVLYPAKTMSMYIADTAQKRMARAAFPTWLSEGIAEFVAKSIAPRLGLPDFDGMRTGEPARPASGHQAIVLRSQHRRPRTPDGKIARFAARGLAEVDSSVSVAGGPTGFFGPISTRAALKIGRHIPA